MDISLDRDLNDKTEKLVAVNFVVEEGDCGILTTTRFVPESVARKYEQDREKHVKDRKNKAELAKQQEIEKVELIRQREIQLSKGMTIFELAKLIISEDKPIQQQLSIYKKANFLAELVIEKNALIEKRNQLCQSITTAEGAKGTCLCDDCRRIYSNTTIHKMYSEIDYIDKRLSMIQQELNR